MTSLSDIDDSLQEQSAEPVLFHRLDPIPSRHPYREWTPRRHISAWLRSQMRLMLRVGIVMIFCGQRRCNLMVDELIVHEEAGAR